MKRLKSMGRSKSSSKAAAAGAANISSQPPSAKWPKVSSTPDNSANQVAQPQNTPADTYINFSDDEIRAMEESALEYAIQQSQQTDRSADGALEQPGQQQEQPTHQPSHQSPQEPYPGPQHPSSAMMAQPQQPYANPQHPSSAMPAQPVMQPQSVEQPQWVQNNHMQQGQSQTPFQANSQPLPESKKKGNFMQRLGLKKQGSKFLATNPSPDPGNPYPMASGGHHPGRWGPQDQTHNNPQPQQPNFGQQQQGYSGGLVEPCDDATAVAAAVAASELAAHESGRLSEQRSVGQEQEEQAMVDLAIKESEVQAEYDNILREAKLLRLDLQHALTKCLEHKTNVQQEHSELSELMGDFDLDNAKGKGIAADHAIEQQFAQSEYNLKQANERVTAVNDAIHELQNLESFIRTTKPPADEAQMLTEEIIRQLLEKLNFLRLDFAPPKEKSVAPNYHSVNIVNRFREQQGSSAEPPRHPQTPAIPPFTRPAKEEEPVLQEQPESSTAGAGPNPFEDEDAPGPSSLASFSLETQQPDSQNALEEIQDSSSELQKLETDTDKAQQMQKPEQQSHASEGVVTPMTTPRSEPQITTPAAVPPTIPPRSPSVTSVPSPRVLNTSDSRSSNESGGGSNPRVLNRFDSRSSNESGGGNNVAMSQSKEQSRQLLEKASQKLASLLVNANEKNFDATRKPGDPAVRRAPQVVHLYQELRKVMGDDFMVQDLNTQDVKTSLLNGMKPYQALSPADEQARQRALAESPSALQAAQAEAEKHSRMLTKLGAQISTTRLRSMEDVLPLVQEADQQLSVLRADEGLTVSQFDAWPKQRLDVLREAAGQFRELNYLQVKYQKWMLQQGTCLEEAARIEEFFDTARARVDWLTNRQELAERRFGNHGIPWDRAAFKATRHASLHLAVIYMSRILFEVANLERSTALKNEQCLLHLSDAVRIAYKAHQFAGGFNVDSAELFGKVKRLTQYYMRSMDPTWLKDTTKFVNSNGQRFDHVQRR